MNESAYIFETAAISPATYRSSPFGENAASTDPGTIDDPPTNRSPPVNSQRSSVEYATLPVSASDALNVKVPFPFAPSPTYTVFADSSTPNGDDAAAVPPTERSSAIANPPAAVKSVPAFPMFKIRLFAMSRSPLRDSDDADSDVNAPDPGVATPIDGKSAAPAASTLQFVASIVIVPVEVRVVPVVPDMIDVYPSAVSVPI